MDGSSRHYILHGAPEGPFDLITASGKTWIKGLDRGFLSKTGLPADSFGKYVLLDVKPGGGPVRITPAKFFEDFSSLKRLSSREKEALRSKLIVNGDSMFWEIDTAFRKGISIRISGDGKNLITKMEGDDFGSLTFTDWNAVPLTSPPPASEIYRES
ncbi:hypothetical protein KEM60_01359 [Austwickia sp. TVS 96-490-7B]|nr:hypothetical protein [Austwickia sp. TVS 96-490-7B]